MTVTYTHGYETVPEDIVGVVCDLVDDMFDAPGGAVRSQSLGSFSVTYFGGDARYLNDDEKELLREHRP